MGFNWAAVAAICSLVGALLTITSIAFVAGRLREKQEEHGKRIDDHDETLKTHAVTLTDHEVRLGRLNEWKDGYNAAARVLRTAAGSLMAGVKAAIDYVLKFEDSMLAGTITETPDGKHTRFGIDEHFHPELTNCLFYSSMGSVAALKIAESIYERQYAEPLCVAEITNQDVANKLLSLGVNCGVVTAAKMLQDALHVSGDGRIGPLTLHALDISDPEAVLGLLKNEAVQHYKNLIAAHPNLEQYQAGWLARAEA